VARDVADPDVDDRRERHYAEQYEGRDLLSPRSPDAERPADRRLVERVRRRAPPAARAVVRAIAAVVDAAATRLDGSHERPSARRRNTSSSDESRVERR